MPGAGVPGEGWGCAARGRSASAVRGHRARPAGVRACRQRRSPVRRSRRPGCHRRRAMAAGPGCLEPRCPARGLPDWGPPRRGEAGSGQRRSARRPGRAGPQPAGPRPVGDARSARWSDAAVAGCGRRPDRAARHRAGPRRRERPQERPARQPAPARAPGPAREPEPAPAREPGSSPEPQAHPAPQPHPASQPRPEREPQPAHRRPAPPPAGSSPVRRGGRQREHRTGPGLLRLRGTSLGGRCQGTSTSSGRLRSIARAGRTGPGSRSGGTGRRQGGRQSVLLPAVPPGASSAGRRHSLRRHGRAQAVPDGRGSRRMLGGRDHGPLGDAVSAVLGRPSAPPSGTAGGLALGVRRTLGQRRNGSCRTPAPPSGGRGALRVGGIGVGTGRVARQEGVHGGPPGPPPPATGTLLGTGSHSGTLGPVSGLRRDAVHGCRRNGSRPTPDGHFEDVRTAAHPRHLVRLEHTAVGPHDPAHDRLVHRVSPAYGPRTSIRTTSPRCAAATTTVLSM